METGACFGCPIHGKTSERFDVNAIRPMLPVSALYEIPISTRRWKWVITPATGAEIRHAGGEGTGWTRDEMDERLQKVGMLFQRHAMLQIENEARPPTRFLLAATFAGLTIYDVVAKEGTFRWPQALSGGLSATFCLLGINNVRLNRENSKEMQVIRDRIAKTWNL